MAASSETTMTRLGPSLGRHEMLHRLKREGPIPVSDVLHDVGISARRLYDIRRFKLQQVPRTVPVLYIGRYHSPEEVLVTWAEHNREALERSGTTAQDMKQFLSGELKAGWEDARERQELDWLDSGWSGPVGVKYEHSMVECPNCGRPCANLPNHIRACDGGENE